MKKLIIIFILLSTICKAQIKEDAYSHYVAGVMIAGITHTVIYDQTGNKFWSFIAGNVAANLAGLAKETIDYNNGGIFSKRDLRNTFYGSISVTIPIGLVTRKRIHRKNQTVVMIWEAENNEKY